MCLFNSIYLFNILYFQINKNVVVSGCYKANQRCDFRADCKDNSDERTCPNVYLFDDCVQITGNANCGWEEEPEDSLNWIIANQTMTEVRN